jgi:molybdate transport repressor ModE-like protein
MNWDDARIFLAFAREGSFGAAARRLGVQHSTVSRRIHAMENDLAAPLVERGASGFTLTRTGGKPARHCPANGNGAFGL